MFTEKNEMGTRERVGGAWTRRKGRARERGTLGETQTDRYRDKKRHKQI